MTFEDYVQEVEKHMPKELPFDVYESRLELAYNYYMAKPISFSLFSPKRVAEFIDRDILDREILKADENR